jgi:uncharacterized protein YukE
VTVQIDLQHSAFERARREVMEAHDGLRRGRDSLSRRAEGLLSGGWTGVAAGQYARAWSEWEHGAERVLGSLLHLSAAMETARARLSASDAEASARASYLEVRLQEQP